MVWDIERVFNLIITIGMAKKSLDVNSASGYIVKTWIYLKRLMQSMLLKKEQVKSKIYCALTGSSNILFCYSIAIQK